MALFRASHMLRQLSLSIPANRPTLSLLSPRHFSTGTEEPQLPSLEPNQFLRDPSQSAVYGRLSGINENTLKTDIINLFEGCSLTLEDIKVEYDRTFNPLAMLLQFPSFSEFSNAFRENNKKGRWLRLDKVDRQQWDAISTYDGNYVLLQGIPRDAVFDDVDRFLSGCNYVSSSFEMFMRGAYPDAIRMAKVRFPSQIEAMNAIIQKNGSFCRNNRIITRLIQ